MAIEEVLNQCIQKWRSANIALAPQVPKTEVFRVWECNGHRLSDDVLALYSTVGGFADWHYEEDFFWCLWPWNGLQEENQKEPGAGMLFCDHSIRAVTWQLRFEDQKHSSVWTADVVAPRQVAADLESFFRAYLDNPWKLL
ncbi:MAG TPA: hypothetical protein VMR25_01065 [Planctomycetaceae bacterium]|jgi:hypothetical protein|nr:hypothetical protein [Planctomycetaceae bacterium]